MPSNLLIHCHPLFLPSLLLSRTIEEPIQETESEKQDKSDIRDKEGDRQLFQRYRVSRRPRLVLGTVLILPKFRR